MDVNDILALNKPLVERLTGKSRLRAHTHLVLPDPKGWKEDWHDWIGSRGWCEKFKVCGTITKWAPARSKTDDELWY